jgi:uncharacterized protein (TIGR02677 family)
LASGWSTGLSSIVCEIKTLADADFESLERQAEEDAGSQAAESSRQARLLQRVPSDMFAFTTSERAALHVAVMQVFGAANERLETALTLDDVLSGLTGVGWYEPLTEVEFERSLGLLVAHGLVDKSQNHGAHYTSAEEFERKNLQYSLTKKGEAAIAGVEHSMYMLSSTGALQTAVLDAIADGLNDLLGLLRGDASDDRRVFAALTALENHLEGLRSNIRQFTNQLQRLLRDGSGDPATFAEVKAATVTYLEEFITNLELRSRKIGEGARRIAAGGGVAQMHRRALAGADLPALPGTDPAPRWLEQRAARWKGLERWFLPKGERQPQIDDLRDIARRAIVSLMRVLEQIGEARRRRSSTVADFRALSRWFIACATEDEAHRLFNSAFGMWPSRHAHLALEDQETVRPSTSWSEAPRAEVSPLLRTHGRLEHTGRTVGVRETKELARFRRRRAMRERAEAEAAWRQLATHGAVRLSSLPALDHNRLQRLLEILGRALGSRPDRSGARRATTLDGRLEMVLSPPEDDRVAYLHTPRGRLIAPDYTIQITVVRDAPAADLAVQQ